MTKKHIDLSSNTLIEFIEPPGSATSYAKALDLRLLSFVGYYRKAFTSCITASVEAFFIVHNQPQGSDTYNVWHRLTI